MTELQPGHPKLMSGLLPDAEKIYMEGKLAEAGAGNQASIQRSACRHCIHYRVSWDPRLPYGCAAHGFKSNRNPALIVYDASGLVCQLFMPREARSRAKKPAC